MDFMNPLWGRISRALSASEDMGTLEQFVHSSAPKLCCEEVRLLHHGWTLFPENLRVSYGEES